MMNMTGSGVTNSEVKGLNRTRGGKADVAVVVKTGGVMSGLKGWCCLTLTLPTFPCKGISYGTDLGAPVS